MSFYEDNCANVRWFDFNVIPWGLNHSLLLGCATLTTTTKSIRHCISSAWKNPLKPFIIGVHARNFCNYFLKKVAIQTRLDFEKASVTILFFECTPINLWQIQVLYSVLCNRKVKTVLHNSSSAFKSFFSWVFYSNYCEGWSSVFCNPDTFWFKAGFQLGML